MLATAESNIIIIAFTFLSLLLYHTRYMKGKESKAKGSIQLVLCLMAGYFYHHHQLLSTLLYLDYYFCLDVYFFFYCVFPQYNSHNVPFFLFSVLFRETPPKNEEECFSFPTFIKLQVYRSISNGMAWHGSSNSQQ